MYTRKRFEVYSRKGEMFMVVRITGMVLRIAAILALILGIIFWTGTAKNLVAIHMLLGIIVTLCLLILGGMIATTRGGIGLAIGAIVLGLIVAGFGASQRTIMVGSSHWIIQVIHLLLGLAAIGLGEMIAGRYKRVSSVATQSMKS
jgi:hypothetical protein